MFINVKPRTEKQTIDFGNRYPLKKSLVAWFLATAEFYTILQYQLRISKAAISIFIPDVCDAIKGFLSMPTTEDE